MNRVLIIGCSLGAAIFFSPSCLAGSVATNNIRFTANIVNWSCNISTTSQSISVDLGTWNTRALKNSGATTTPTYFSISLSHCNNTSLTTTFSGNPDSNDSNDLALDSASTATGVAIQLMESDKTALALNKASTAVPINGSGNATLGFYAAYVATAKKIQAGSANAEATFTINYN